MALLTRSRRRVVSYLWMSVVLACLLALIASASSRGSASKSGGTVVVAERTAPSTLDPTQSSDTNTARAWELVYETLVLATGGGTKIEPMLATRWTVSRDRLTYTFHLRPGVKFHNGAPLTARDVVFTFKRLKTKGIPFAVSLFPGLKSVTATGPLTVKFVHTAPNAAFLLQLGDPSVFGGAILNEKAATTSDPSRSMVGTGPMMMVSYDPQSQMVLRRFPKYWGKPAKANRIVVKYMPDPNARLVALRAGQIDVMFPDATQATGFRGNSKIAVKPLQGCDYGEVAFNNVGPLHNVQVRRAIAMAIDRNQFAKQAYLGQATPMGYTSPCYGWSLPPEKTPYYTQNIPKAKKLLALNGYENGFELRINAIAGISDANNRAQEVLQAQLAKIGIRATIEMNDMGTWLSKYLGAKAAADAGSPPTYDLTSFQGNLRTNPAAVLTTVGREVRYGGGIPAGIEEAYRKAISGPPAEFIKNISALALKQAQLVFPGFKTVSVTSFVAYRKDRVTGVAPDPWLNRRFLFQIAPS